MAGWLDGWMAGWLDGCFCCCWGLAAVSSVCSVRLSSRRLGSIQSSAECLPGCPLAECLAFLWVVDWVQVKALEGHRVVEGSCGGTHTMVVTDEGRCFIWGRGAFGRCGALPALAGGCCAGSS